MTNQQYWILGYLYKKHNRTDYVSPSVIGDAWKKGQHSAWASPKCKKLIKEGLLMRNHRGCYRLTSAGRTLIKMAEEKK